MEQEIWKDIPDYEGLYQCSDLGRVKSFKNHYGRGNIILSGFPDKNGYLKVSLYKNRILKTFKVHQLVAMCFLGHTPCGLKLVVDHIDGKVLNNNLQNLRVVTSRENTSTCFRKNKDLFTSKYVGVYWDNEHSKWRASLSLNGRVIHIGRFESEINASEAYISTIKIVNDSSKSIEDVIEHIKTFCPNSSKYKGVCWDENRCKWMARINSKYIGRFKTEIEAHNAYQKKLKELTEL